MSNDTTTTREATMEQDGSFTRLTIGGPHNATPRPGPILPESTRVYGGTFRTNLTADAEVEHVGHASFTAGQDIPAGSVMATMQRINGRETVELQPGIPASRTYIRQALTDGLIEEVNPGVYRDKGTDGTSTATAGPQGGTTGAPEDAPAQDPGAGVFDPAEDAEWSEAIEPLTQHGYDGAVASVTVAVLSGSDSLESAAKNLARQEAMPLEQAAQYVQEGHDMYERHVAKEAAGAGIEDKTAFYAWMRDNKGRALHEAIQNLTARRDIGKFRTLALEFKSIANR